MVRALHMCRGIRYICKNNVVPLQRTGMFVVGSVVGSSVLIRSLKNTGQIFLRYYPDVHQPVRHEPMV
jgi:hypothetical protein